MIYASNFEAEFAKALKAAKVPVKYEKKRLSYVRVAHYTPDWELPNGIIVETKGKFTAQDRKKHKLIREQHPELDIRFIFMRDNTLNRKSTTRYSDWCVKYGFKFAVGDKPDKYWATVEEWINESG